MKSASLHTAALADAALAVLVWVAAAQWHVLPENQTWCPIDSPTSDTLLGTELGLL